MEFTGKKVLVFGTGISGIAAANLLETAGAEVVLFDGNEKLDKAHVLENFAEGRTPELYIGALPEEVEKELDLVVLSRVFRWIFRSCSVLKRQDCRSGRDRTGLPLQKK